MYVADFRFDEGIRIREKFISPCLCANNDFHNISNSFLLIEVMEKENKTNSVKVKTATHEGFTECKVGGGDVNGFP